MPKINDSYVALAASKDIEEISQPLAKLLGSYGFSYHKIFPDGHEIFLSNDLEVVRHLHENNLNLGSEYLDYIASAKAHNFKSTLWPSENKMKILSDIRAIRDCVYGISFWNNKNDYFGFSIKQEKDIRVINRFINNIDQLERFCLFFLEKAENLIKEASKNPIIFHQKMVIENKSPLFATDFKEKFIQETPITMYRTNVRYLERLKLTMREIDCLRLVIKGYTGEEIALALELSARTVETHLENIKNKVNVTNKNDLIKFVFTNKIDKFL